MEIKHKVIIFIYYLCIIILTMILFGFVFGVVTNRLLGSGSNSSETKYYYLEVIGIWIVLLTGMIYIKYNLNQFSKKNITEYVESKELLKSYDEYYLEIDDLIKFDTVIIIGFIIIFFGSIHNTFKEKIKLLNEDLAIASEI
jgi:hypothetical protein